MRENVIEWRNGQDVATVTFSQKRYITKVRKLAEKHADLVTILRENEDGSIVAHLPVKSVKLSIISPTERMFSATFGRGAKDENE